MDTEAPEQVWATNREKQEDNVIVGFMCLTDWEWELGAASGGNTVYPDEENIRAHRRCVEACGIVEVEVRFRRVVHPSTERR